jgi:hypothetical protein
MGAKLSFSDLERFAFYLSKEKLTEKDMDHWAACSRALAQRMGSLARREAREIKLQKEGCEPAEVKPCRTVQQARSFNHGNIKRSPALAAHLERLKLAEKELRPRTFPKLIDCAHCKKPFIKLNGRQTVCSRLCGKRLIRGQAKIPDSAQCVNCAAIFKPKRTHNNVARFCSRICQKHFGDKRRSSARTSAGSGIGSAAWRKLKKLIETRKHFACYYGKTHQHRDCPYGSNNVPKLERTIDHIISIAQGGTDAASNLVMACQRCNFRKKTKTTLHFTGQGELALL